MKNIWFQAWSRKHQEVPGYFVVPESKEVCWERQSRVCSFLTPHSATWKWALGLEHFLTKRQGALTARVGLWTCVGISFSVLDSVYAPLSCLIRLSNSTLPTAYCILSWVLGSGGEGTGSFTHSTRRVHAGHHPGSAVGGDLLAMGKPMSTHEAHLALSPLYVSRALFHCKIVWGMSFLVTLNHGVGWLLELLLLMEWDPLPGGDNNCYLLDKIINTEVAVWRTLLCQRRDSLSINRIMNAFNRNSLNVFFKKHQFVLILNF